jgi:TetR/AcrR family transcriptional regulator, transcriptional repressor for nem operon
MGRPREFDEDEAVAAARAAFWSGGVNATSISDLAFATGLSVGSIYKAFGSKAELCHRTLDDYLDAGLASASALLDSAESAIDGVAAWLGSMAEQAGRSDDLRGCYAVLCATELAAHDEEARTRLRLHDERLRGRVADALRSAVAAGDLECDPVIGAQLLCATVNGVQVEARKGIDRAVAHRILRLALDGLR